MNKQVYKKSGEELQQWLYFIKRHFVKKDKTKYTRKEKHKNKGEE